MAEYIDIPVYFNGSRTVSVSAGSSTTSDAFLYGGNATGAQGTFKALSSTATPTANDEVSVYIVNSAGDPDGKNAGDEFASADTTHAIQVGTLDTLVANPALVTEVVPVAKQGKVHFVNTAAVAITCSAIIRELIE